MFAAHDEFLHRGLAATLSDFVLIGGGATASTFLIRLAEHVRCHGVPEGGLTIHAFDKKGAANGGVAYGACSDNHILNSVRSEMSPWRPDAFHEYCVSKGLGTCREDFNKRKDYAAFLQQEVREAVEILEAAGVRFHARPHDVTVKACRDGAYADGACTDGADANGAYDIVDADSGAPLLSGCTAQQILVTVGYGPNENFKTLREAGTPSYIHSLYGAGAQAVNAIPDGAHIVFVGRGPALYDFANDLKGAGVTQARLTVLSRSSTLPLAVRDVGIEATEESRTPDFITTGSCQCAHDLHGKISAEFAQAAGSPRRTALDILRNLKHVLKGMPVEEAQAFQRSATMEMLRHTATPVPAQSHVTLMDYKPVFRQATLGPQDVVVKPQGLSVRIAPDEVVHADYIVNGTGHGRHNAPLLEGFKKNGFAQLDPVLGVLKTDESGYRLTGSGIACIGPATHAGCDGVESFDLYVQDFIADMYGAHPAYDVRTKSVPSYAGPTHAALVYQ